MTRAVGSLGLCVLLLLGGAGPVAAQNGASRLLPSSADSGWPPPRGIASSMLSFPAYRLLPEDSSDHEPWMGSADVGLDAPLNLGLAPQRPAGTPLASSDALSGSALWSQLCPARRLASADSGECARRVAFADAAMDAPAPLDTSEDELPQWAFLKRHRLLISTLIPFTSVVGVTSNAILGYDTRSFRIHHEGWFGENTTNGGADKASHITDYFVIMHLFEDVYRMLGWSRNEAIVWGFGVAVATGLANEVGDGFTRHGFSWEDFGADTAGATAASVISLTRTNDLLGMRTSHLRGSTYTHDVYSADLKLSGVGQRLGLDIGPLRWLLFSVTYNAKGYRVSPPEELQRLVGFEIGLNFQQILNDVGVKRSTWWGYALHLVGDNIRFPFTAIGMRYDVNHGKWHGPNAGNYD